MPFLLSNPQGVLHRFYAGIPLGRLPTSQSFNLNGGHPFSPVTPPKGSSSSYGTDLGQHTRRKVMLENPLGVLGRYGVTAVGVGVTAWAASGTRVQVVPEDGLGVTGGYRCILVHIAEPRDS